MRWDFSKPFDDDENSIETDKVKEILRHKKESLPLTGAWKDVLAYDAYRKHWEKSLADYFQQLKRGLRVHRVREAKKKGEISDEAGQRVSEKYEQSIKQSSIDSKMNTVRTIFSFTTPNVSSNSLVTHSSPSGLRNDRLRLGTTPRNTLFSNRNGLCRS